MRPTIGHLDALTGALVQWIVSNVTVHLQDAGNGAKHLLY